MPKAPSTEEVARRNGRTSSSQGGERGEDRPPTGRVSAPSSRYTEYEEGGKKDALASLTTPFDVFDLAFESNDPVLGAVCFGFLEFGGPKRAR